MTPSEGSQQEETPILGSALCLFVGRGDSSRSGMREENMAGGGDFCLEGNAMIVVFCYSCPEDFLMGRLEKFFVGYWNFFIGCMHYRATRVSVAIVFDGRRKAFIGPYTTGIIRYKYAPCCRGSHKTKRYLWSTFFVIWIYCKAIPEIDSASTVSRQFPFSSIETTVL